jgi:2-dehydro-3-deoxyphosphogluconate aldolase/(4S)-4-hydroxy-2-oxoglutarate aldolase
MTATEIQAALALGVTLLKFFPAEASGGLATIEALSAAFPSVRFVPTGGIAADSAPRYLAHHAVVAVGGTWITPAPLLAARDWAAISGRAADAATRLRG